MLPLAVLHAPNATTAAIAASLIWACAAFGVGMIYPTLGVLLLESSTSHAADSASIQMADSLGVIVGTAITGALLTSASVTGSQNSAIFGQIWLITAFFGGVAWLASRRCQTTMV